MHDETKTCDRPDVEISEVDSRLDDLLAGWHRWASGYSAVPISSACPQFRDVRTPKHWDTTSDAFDEELDDRVMKTVDCQVDELPDDDGRTRGGPNRAYRSAIHALARNLATGAFVWSSPRLPRDPIERSIVVIEARNMLTRRLRVAGVM